MAYHKNIKFIYYRLFSSDLRRHEIFSFIDMIPQFERMPLIDRIHEIDGDKYRLENLERSIFNEIRVYHLRFMKLEEVNLPNLSYDNYESEPLVLEEGQYLGTPLHVLYDIDNEVFMIQQNRPSMNERKLNEYVNYWVHAMNLLDDRHIIEFRPIISNHGVINNGSYKKIELSFANIQEAEIDDNTNLHELINCYQKYGALTGSITISIGHRINNQLNSEEVNSLTQDIINNRGLFNNAKVYYREHDYSGFIDLIEEIMQDTICFIIERRTTLALVTVQISMLDRYAQRINEIMNELGEIDEE